MVLSRLISLFPSGLLASLAANACISPSHFALVSVTFGVKSKVEEAFGPDLGSIAEGCKAGKSFVIGMC